MRCTKCGCLEDRVIDSRASREGATIRRRRECLRCGNRFTTYEQIEHEGLMVIKRDGRTEEFDKEKLTAGIRAACRKRPVSQNAIEEIAANIVEEISEKFDREVPSMAIGERVLEELRKVDPIAFLRFSSVYRRFEKPDQFALEAKKLSEKTYDPTQSRLPAL